MPRLMLNGKLPSKEELMTDDLIKQMVDEAKAEGEKGKEGLVTKETVIQSLTVADIPDGIKADLKKDVPTKDTIMQALTADDVGKLPEAVKQKVLDDAHVAPVVPEVIQSFVKQTIQAAKADGKGTITEPEGEKSEKSLSQAIMANRI